jgi:hypothetical protein
MPPRLRCRSSVAALALLWVAACSRGGATDSGDASAATAAPSTRTASCDRITAMSVCSEYTGAYLDQGEALHLASCKRLGGTFVAASCPNTSVLGSCALGTGEVRRFYGGGGAPYDVARADRECRGTYKGTWSTLK